MGLSLSQVYARWGFMIVLSGTLAVDTFFLLSGFLMSFLLMKQLDKTKGGINPLLMIVHRYIR